MVQLSDFGIGNYDRDRYIGRKAYITEDNPRIAALDYMAAHGYTPPKGIFRLGDFMRFKSPSDNRPSGTAGWGIYHEFTSNDEIIGVLTFGDWKTDEIHKWSNKRYDYMTATEKHTYNERLEHAMAMVAKQRDERRAEVAKEAMDIWKNAHPVREHPYVTAKQIKPYGARLQNNFLLVPVYHHDELVNLQKIHPDGKKRPMTGGRMKGGYCVLKGSTEVYITEGYATACTIREATGATVYVCFMVSNLYDCAAMVREKHPDTVPIIAADDDRFTDGNPGLSKARAAAEASGCRVVEPALSGDSGTDFNDMAEQVGIDGVKKYLSYKPAGYEEDKSPANDMEDIDAPPGVISDYIRYFNATSGQYNPEFGLVAALAFMSVMCGRYFVTDKNNNTSLYFVAVGRSGIGKEHIKQSIETVIGACGQRHIIAGDGFTSSGAVISLLMEKPRSISCTDEFGRYLQAASSLNNSMQNEANTTLMECITRTRGTVRPRIYSGMGVKKEQNAEQLDRYVENPAFTLIGLTTPVNYYSSIGGEKKADGFMSRFIVVESDRKRTLRRDVARIDVPERIIDWVNKIKERYKLLNPLDIATQKPVEIEIFFDKDAFELQREFEQKMIDLMEEVEHTGLSEIPNRSNEFSMRLALIVALSRDPDTFAVKRQDVEWATRYIEKHVRQLLKTFMENVTESKFDSDRLEILEAIRKNQDKSLSQMKRLSAMKKHKPRDLNEILQSLEGAGLIEKATINTGGRPAITYLALEDTK